MKEIMTKAWSIYRTLTEGTHREKLSAAMKLAWAWAREKDSESGLDKLLTMGANRWTKGGHDRLYLSRCGAQIMNLEIECYKTGNISSAVLNGEKISNAEASRIISAYANAYIDLSNGKVYGASGRYASDFEEKVLAIYAA